MVQDSPKCLWVCTWVVTSAIVGLVRLLQDLGPGRPSVGSEQVEFGQGSLYSLERGHVVIDCF